MVSSHKTAIRRYELSRPLKSAIRDAILNENDTIFDYGCGRGDDLEILQSMNYNCRGWDPAHKPDVKRLNADIVNLGYVINVIPDKEERSETLQEAFNLSNKVLVVAGLLDISSNTATSAKVFGDGHLTSRNTFQKLYTQQELKNYIDETLGVESFPASPGIFYVFKDNNLRESFLQNRVKRHVDFLGRKRITIAERYAEHRELLESFVNCIYELGRLPKDDEFDQVKLLNEKIGSIKKAYRIINHLFPDHTIEERRNQRHDDLLVYLALANFRSYPSLKFLSNSLQNDMKLFFGSYKKAKETGMKLLFDAGNPDKVSQECRKSPIGKQLPEDLYIHNDYKDRLSPLLRVYLGCGEAFIGNVEGTNIIKIHMRSSKISYLKYKDFDKTPHPCLVSSTTVMLRERRVRFLDYSNSDNPPILHRKETLLDTDYPYYRKFKKLTETEEKAGLLVYFKGIGYRKQWEDHLSQQGYKLRGHQLLKLKP